MNDIDISVIILARNSEKYLDAALRAVFVQEINLKFEVVVVDSGSTDNSLNIIAKYPVKIYQVSKEEFNHGLTRNYGISQSQGEYIILLTPDAVPCDKHWMVGLVGNLAQDEAVAGVYSRQAPHKNSSLLTQIRVRRFFTASHEKKISQIKNAEDYQKLSPAEKHRLCNFDNVSSCIRRSVWEKIPFSKTDFGEDLEWAKRVLEAGYKVVYEPESAVFHAHEFSIRSWYERNRLNSHKLFLLFGINSVPNIFRLFTLTLAHTFRDIASLCRAGISMAAISSFFLIPLYAFSGLFGQYRGAKIYAHTSNRT